MPPSKIKIEKKQVTYVDELKENTLNKELFVHFEGIY